MEESHVLLFSGGIDSYVGYFYLKKTLSLENLKTVYFDLGAPYNKREIEVVKKLIPETIIDESLKVGDTQRGVNAFIPYRNMLIAMLCAKYGKHIWICGLKDDKVEDKNPKAFEEMTKCLNFISKPEDEVKIDSPFWGMTKAQVVKWYMDNVDSTGESLLNTISCYDGNEKTNYCGRCPSCFRKFNALKENGINIEFYNQEMLNDYIKRADQYEPERRDSILKLKKYKCKKIYNVDIDGTLTVETAGFDYAKRTPNKIMIEEVNKLYDEGNRIDLYTSRLGIENDKEVTELWLKENNVKYTTLTFGKPHYDFILDDKSLRVKNPKI